MQAELKKELRLLRILLTKSHFRYMNENWKSKVLQWPFDFWTLCNSKFVILDFFWRNAIDRVSQIAFWVVVTSDIRYKVQVNGR